MNELLQGTNDFEEEHEEPKGVERPKKVKPQKREPTVEELNMGTPQDPDEPEPEPEPVKKKTRSPAQIEATKRLVEARKAAAQKRREAKAAEEAKPRKVGRPKTREIIREKIIYLAPQPDGSYEPVKVKKPTKREIRAFDNEQEVIAQEQETGTKVRRRVNGKADGRSTGGKRTEAQIAAAKRLGEMARKRAEEKRKAKEEAKHQDKEEFKEEIANTIIDVVSKPIEKVKQERKVRTPSKLTEEQMKALAMKKQRDLFS
jgi:hypothetical protein